MTIRKKIWLSIIAIILIALAAGFVSNPNAPGFSIGSFTRSLNIRLGLDLQGGSVLLYEADTSTIAPEDQDSALQGVRDVIERRVNAFGVAEPVVRTIQSGDSYRISVELAGITDINEAISLIGETPTLEFKEEVQPVTLTGEEQQQAQEENEAVRQFAQSILDRVKNGESFETLADQYSEDPSNTTDPTTGQKNGGDLGFARRGSYVAEFEDVLFDKLSDGEIYPDIVRTDFGYHIIKRTDTQTFDENGEQVEQVRASHILFRTRSETEAVTDPYTSTGLSGKQLDRSYVDFSSTTGEPEVVLQFNDEGKNLFAEITERNVGKTVAIYLDGVPISTPVVQQAIPSGQAIITGNFNLEEAKQLVERLNAGALPIPISLLSQQTIDATLGQESIYKSLFAGIFGLILVAFFMIMYYRLPGVLAVIALIIYTLIILAIFKLWPVTLTLAGIAGFILSIGIAVDANILIFERTKEELRAGAPLPRAIESGFDRAWPSIRDSNISSIITSFILIWFGTSFIRGFAITLIIGILVSMFSAITISRTLLRVIYLYFPATRSWFFGVKNEPKSQSNV